MLTKCNLHKTASDMLRRAATISQQSAEKGPREKGTGVDQASSIKYGSQFIVASRKC